MPCFRAAARERPVASNTDIDPADGPEDPGPFLHRIACTVRLPCPRIHHRRPGAFRLSQTGLLDPARLVDPIGLDAAKNFAKAQNIDRLLRE
jgi:hypothetical protein